MKAFFIIIGVIIFILIIQYVRYMTSLSQAKKSVVIGQCTTLGVSYFPFKSSTVCRDENGSLSLTRGGVTSGVQ